MNRALRRAGVAIAAAVAIVLGTTALAFACHNTITSAVLCDQNTGNYDVTWIIQNSEDNDSEVLSNATRAADQINGEVVQGGHALYVTEEVAPGAGALTLSVKGTWPNRHVSTINTGTAVVPDGGCKKPPPCTACHMVKKHTDAAKVTTCKGILPSGTYNSIYVKPNTDCTLVGGYVNGSIRANGAHSLTLGDVNVRGTIHASHITTNFMYGSSGSTCSADPMVGGSILAKHSHNVVICNAQVCHRIVVKDASGRVMVKDSRTNRLVVKHNDRFVKDGAPRHTALASVRLFHDKAHVFAIGFNKRPVLRRHLVHSAKIGGGQVCTPMV